MIDILYISYSYHDRAQRPRGLVSALVGEGIRPFVIHRPIIGDAPVAHAPWSDSSGPVPVPAQEPGYDRLRDLSRALRGRSRATGSRGARMADEGGSADAVREIPRWIQEILAFPDRHCMWIRSAVAAGLDAARRSNPRLIYASAWPMSALIVGRKLARILGLPLVIEFRDLWVDNPFSDYRFSWRRRIDRAWERRMIMDSVRVVVVTEPMRAALLAAHPGVAPERICVVPNGFDPGDMPSARGDAEKHRDPAAVPNPKPESAEGVVEAGRIVPDGRPVLAHIGHLYGRRSPQALIEAIESLRVSPDSGPPLRLRLVGRVSPDFLPMLATGEREGWIERSGPVPYDESLREMQRAQCLLLLIENGRGAEGIMTGKVFPYLATGRPILALVPPEGVAAGLIRRSGAGMIVDPDDVQGIAGALREWIEGSRQFSALDERKDLLRAHSWPVLGSRLVKILREACGTDG